MQKMVLRPGETFRIDAVTMADGAPVDITGFNIRSQVRNSDNTLIGTLNITINPDQINYKGAHVLDFGIENTGSLAPGELYCDVRYEKDDVVFATEKFGIHVTEPGVTQ